jgi:RHS repeat-associated protein
VQTNTNNATIASYQSNALGERVMASYTKGDATKTRYYLYDKQQRIAELDEAGNVVQQYLYVNQTPVAVINTPTTSSDSNQAGIIAIHTDRRHAPMMATDKQGKVIWQAEYDAWGKVIPATLREERGNPNQSNQANTFNLALRLPGQWQDQATGLHYNYQRDYNPETGRYLTPDPLGFPDGADPYAYVNNDPLNKLDPLGLYQSDIHYYMTFFLGVVAGIPIDDARTIALAAQYIDVNRDTRPLDPDNPLDNIGNQEAIDRLLSYHFTATPSDIGEDGLTHSKVTYLTGNSGMRIIAEAPKDPAYANIQENQQLVRLYDAVSLAKCNALGRNTELQFFGEYLHAFQDTFGHRDANNIPIDVQNGVGHGTYNSNPDYTYNHVALFDFLPLPGHVNWNNNEARTLQMEKEVFAKMKQFATGQDVISAEKISEKAFYEFLAEFNDLEEDEDNKKYVKGDVKSGEAPSGAKVNKLQEKLNEWFGAGVINLKDFNNAAYNETKAANNRNSFLCVNGKPLDQKVYEGTILPTSCN